MKAFYFEKSMDMVGDTDKEVIEEVMKVTSSKEEHRR